MAISFVGSSKSYVVIGNDATTQNLFVFENGYKSRVNVNIRSLMIGMDVIGVLTAVVPVYKVSRATSISGGQILEKAKYDTAKTSDENVLIRVPCIEAARITATPGTTMWQKMCSRQHTAVGQNVQIGVIENMLPWIIEESGKTFVIRPGEALLVQKISAAVASNSALSDNMFVECMWEEDTIATFTISGTVTLSGVPVTGAKVMVVEADDVLLTNAHLREVITTPAGGTWSSTIRTGKIGAAFVQYKNGSTYYTAPGSPYLA